MIQAQDTLVALLDEPSAAFSQEMLQRSAQGSQIEMDAVSFLCAKTVEECADPVRTIGNVEKYVSEKSDPESIQNRGKSL
ncbi:MAG: hypothetical protein ACLTCB_04865 [Merdibacter sp.]